MPPPPHTKPENVLKVGRLIFLQLVVRYAPSANISLTPSERKNLSQLSSHRLLLRFFTNMLRLRDPGIVPSRPSSR